ncbi:tetratricopeptide repeat-containing sulfotransferase family protein [Thalassospira marina]|nr:tetratricopeptide repeat-containing sulfotransferase family protein [Thalassospira marina]
MSIALFYTLYSTVRDARFRGFAKTARNQNHYFIGTCLPATSMDMTGMAKKDTSGSDEQLTIPQAIERAYAHWNAGQAQQAEILARRVLDVSPAQIECFHLLALIAHAYQKPDLAIEYMRKACQPEYAPGVYFANYAEICRQQGLLAEAETAARTAVKRQPDYVGGWNNLGIILQEEAQLDEAISCLEKVVKLEPENPEARNNLANTMLLSGRYGDAQSQYETALQLHPNYAEAHSNLGHLQTKQGLYAEASEHLRLAIEINPQLIDAYTNFVELELAQNNNAAAMRRLESLLHFAPEHPSALIAYARLLRRRGDLEAALKSVRRAIEIAPHIAAAHNVLGEILHDQDQIDDALASYSKAATLPGREQEQAQLNVALLRMHRGEKQTAIAVLRDILARNPRCLPAWNGLADIKPFAKDDADYKALLTVKTEYENGDFSLSVDNEMILHFLLGKVYLDAGDSDAAFAHLAHGNAMKRKTFEFDAEKTRGWLRSIKQTLSRDWLAKQAGAGNASRVPVFVVGMPRSGTTLTEQILGAHPDIYAAGELRKLQQVVDNLGPYPTLAQNITPETLQTMADDYLSVISSDGVPHSRHVDKMPANFLYAGLIHAMFPNAKIIHCRRDPVDTCLSCYSKLFSAEQLFTYDLKELGIFHLGYQELMAHWRDVLPAESFIEIDYEDTVNDLESQARRLIDFVGLPWNDACLDFHKAPRSVRTASVNQVREPVYKTAMGRSKAHAKHLTPLTDILATGK